MVSKYRAHILVDGMLQKGRPSKNTKHKTENKQNKNKRCIMSIRWRSCVCVITNMRNVRKQVTLIYAQTKGVKKVFSVHSFGLICLLHSEHTFLNRENEPKPKIDAWHKNNWHWIWAHTNTNGKKEAEPVVTHINSIETYMKLS